jgi:hypothetical protein
MAKVIAVTEAFKSLGEVETRLGLSRCEDSAFFREWRESLPTLSEAEQDRLTILPQALAYMMANTQTEQPTFGLMTNGDDVLFVKLTTQPSGQYSLSRVFSLYTLPEELQSVLQVLKQIGQAIAQT